MDMLFQKIDLHMHTTVSDGTDSPLQIIKNVRKAGITLFSVTDHDAYKCSLLVPRQLKTGDPAFITGVEFSCRDEEGSYHILGYGYDPEADAIRKVMEQGHKYRMNKLTKRLDRLETEYGFVFRPEDVAELESQDNPGKPHIANLMVKYGYAESKDEAMIRYLNRLHYRSEYVRPETAITGILKAGGIPVLAHPSYGSGSQMITGENMDARIRKLMVFGLMGLEGYYSGFSQKLRNEILAFAEKYGLYVTAGSDYHGCNKTIGLGQTGLDGNEYPEGLLRFLQDINDRIYNKEQA
ncbi:MAG: PHP domain-containing protein [Solobacterium sp.]|nr:PHP domain-containing protein [Solobacterium sp.]